MPAKSKAHTELVLDRLGTLLELEHLTSSDKAKIGLAIKEIERLRALSAGTKNAFIEVNAENQQLREMVRCPELRAVPSKLFQNWPPVTERIEAQISEFETLSQARERALLLAVARTLRQVIKDRRFPAHESAYHDLNTALAPFEGK